ILAYHFMLCDDLAKIAEREKAFWIDYGPDFYAVRAWNNYAPDEKRIIWTGWMGCWRYTATEPRARIQSVPRSLTLKTFPEGIRLLQNPITELGSLRKANFTVPETTFEGIWAPEKLKPSRNVYEITVEFENISSEEFGLKLCVGGNEQTVVGYTVRTEELYVDRSHSGLVNFSGLFPQINRGPMKNRNNTLRLDIFVDKCSVEVFGNDGETIISSKIYPDPTSLGIELFSNKGKVKVKSLNLWEMEKVSMGLK
ncbi:MAG: GH32 C-terminal domain-containing protein, partial [Bacteroidota bacterium]|nr:GH32 C-terminal domain-containing protein [Bacteroidota bacterium]